MGSTDRQRREARSYRSPARPRRGEGGENPAGVVKKGLWFGGEFGVGKAGVGVGRAGGRERAAGAPGAPVLGARKNSPPPGKPRGVPPPPATADNPGSDRRSA